MGNGNLDVDPESIRRGGNGIRSTAHQIQAEWEALQAKLAGYGEPWGQDMLGMLIGGCYLAINEVITECIQENVNGLQDHAEGTTVMAANYLQAEDASAIEVNRVRQILG
jgi:hypothetical protein